MRFCARVVAAALMVGAIGAALAFPARFGPGETHPRALTAPPSTLQRTLYVPAVPAPRQRAALAVTHIHHAVQISPSAGTALAAVRPVAAPRATQKIAAAQQVPASRTPARPRQTVVVSRELASAPPPATAPPPPAATPPPPTRHGHGHAYGHDKAKAKGKPPVVAPPVSVPPASPPVTDAAATDHGNDGAAADAPHGNGHAYGHDKQEAVGG